MTAHMDATAAMKDRENGAYQKLTAGFCDASGWRPDTVPVVAAKVDIGFIPGGPQNG